MTGELLQTTDFQALTFDVYGTLIDWETGIADALAPWAERNGLDADRTALLAAFARHESARQRAHPELRYPELLERVFEDIAHDFGVPPTQSDAAAFGESVQDWPAFADVPNALDYLSQFFRLGVVSNVDRASFVFSQNRMGMAFDVLVTAEDAGAYKPDPAPFHMLLDWMNEIGVGNDRVLHVAQSPFHDLVPAKQLGLTTCWIDRQGLADGGGWGATPQPDSRPAPDLRFASLAELVEADRRARAEG